MRPLHALEQELVMNTTNTENTGIAGTGQGTEKYSHLLISVIGKESSIAKRGCIRLISSAANEVMAEKDVAESARRTATRALCERVEQAYSQGDEITVHLFYDLEGVRVQMSSLARTHEKSLLIKDENTIIEEKKLGYSPQAADNAYLGVQFLVYNCSNETVFNNVSIISRVIENDVLVSGYSKDRSQDIRLALDEALANAVKHGTINTDIELLYQQYSDKVSFRISNLSNDGKKIPVERLQKSFVDASIEEKVRLSNDNHLYCGITIIRSLADKVIGRNQNNHGGHNCNELEMIFYKQE